jgi:Iron-containing redox enzyme
MLDLSTIASNMPRLQAREWPPLNHFRALPPDFAEFLELGAAEQARYLAERRAGGEEFSQLLHSFLDAVSSYIFGYADSPVAGCLRDELEIRIQQAKIVLERELLEGWLRPLAVPPIDDQRQAREYLLGLAAKNSSLTHPLFPFLREKASPEALRNFLRTEVTRNEVVDDEVAMLLPGLQGAMKLAIASNLWDECGRGRLEHFHTYWLRRLIDASGDWDGLKAYRATERPWFSQITTNVFNVFLTRPGIRLMAYGWFLVNESWVAPHFEDILAGMRRVDLADTDRAMYFTAHRTIDPMHTAELSDALGIQVPALRPSEIALVVGGAHAAVAATTAQYDRMLQYVRRPSEGA